MHQSSHLSQIIASYELYMNIMGDHISTGKLFPSSVIQYHIISLASVFAFIVVRYNVYTILYIFKFWNIIRKLQMNKKIKIK